MYPVYLLFKRSFIYIDLTPHFFYWAGEMHFSVPHVCRILEVPGKRCYGHPCDNTRGWPLHRGGPCNAVRFPFWPQTPLGNWLGTTTPTKLPSATQDQFHSFTGARGVSRPELPLHCPPPPLFISEKQYLSFTNKLLLKLVNTSLVGFQLKAKLMEIK